MKPLRHEAEVALSAAREAAAVILRVYAAPFDVEWKAKDDPVTVADKEANALLCDRLGRAFPGVPLVAEESDPAAYANFGAADAAWFIDPLDGTREFVAKNGEFAVMLGFAERGRATVGVILAPAWGRAFVGVVGEGAWEVDAGGTRREIHVSARDTLAGATFLVSRSRAPERLAAFIASVGGKPVAHGSSGLKGALVATGDADVYLQPGRAGMRWDACATEALVKAAGGDLTETSGAELDYRNGEIGNERGMLATNLGLHRAVIEAFARRNDPIPTRNG